MSPYAHAPVDVVQRLKTVRQAIHDAARAAGRKPDAVQLVAVSKYHPIEAIEAAYEAGQRDFGENYAQELAAKAEALASKQLSPTWHFIGQLQRNKVASVVQWAHVIHSVDSLRLAKAISRAVLARALPDQAPRSIAIFLQVNFDQEAQKGGVAPDAVVPLAQAVAQLPGLRLVGLMAVPPDPQRQDKAAAPSESAAQGYFEALERLGQEVYQACEGRCGQALSMGMSHDFACAIGVGATLVRIGTAVFGPRPPRRSA